MFVQSIGNRIYYQCYGINNMNMYSNSNSSNNNNEGVYYISYASFNKYMQTTYMQPNTNNNTNTNNNNSNSNSNYIMGIGSESVKSKFIQLNSMNVLSSIWTRRFGDAFTNINISNKNKNKDDDDTDPYIYDKSCTYSKNI